MTTGDASGVAGDVVGFINARLDAMEAAAKAVADDYREVIDTGDDPWPSERAFAEMFSVTRVRSMAAGLRAVVALHQRADWQEGDPVCETCVPSAIVEPGTRAFDAAFWPCPTLVAIAGIWEGE